MATIATTYECPTCVTNGKPEVRLTADLAKNEMFCENSHRFPADEIDSGMAAEPEPALILPPPPPPQQMSTEELPEKVSPVQQAPAPAAPEKLAFKPETPVVVPAELSADFSLLPGGRVRAAVVIEEQDWMGIKAEAENQNQTPMQYLQETLSRAMSNRWFY